MSTASHCLACGACCAHFRVSFYWAEAAAADLPDALVEPLTPVMACMAGTNRARPHCAALTGTVGQAVACKVYDRRPSPCRDVLPGDDRCRRARRGHGLPPLDENPPSP